MKFVLFCTILTSICLIIAHSHPVEENDRLTRSQIQSVIEHWKKTRPVDCGDKQQQPKIVKDLKCNLDQVQVDEIQSYQEAVNQIIDLFITGKFKGQTFELLSELTDSFGSRLVGSQALDDSIEWVLSQAEEQGFAAYTEDVTAPHWVRNDESLTMTSPRTIPMTLLGLGYSIKTPPGGVTAEVLVVSSFEELYASADAAMGKIIVYDVPYTTYGETVTYRSVGAVEAAKVGAVASLVRSITDFSLHTPHTGMQHYSSNVTKIPAASITVEDANMLHRMQNEGEKIVLNLKMEAANLPEIVTRNTILEIKGTQSPDEVVVVSGHLDSWDVGTGVMDDAGGCVISWIAGKALNEMNFKPRRTFRVIMFTAEEIGMVGGEAYFEAHGTKKNDFQLMMESDIGTFYPRGIAVTGSEETMCIMQEILALTEILGTTKLISPAETPDLGAFTYVGVPMGSLYSDNERYFWYHHSPADRMEVYDSDTLDRVAALWTAVSYVASDISFRLPHQTVDL